METELTAEQRDYVETVRASGDTLLEIINDILDFSKIEAGRVRMERIDFSPKHVTEEAVELFAEPAANKGIELVLDVEPEVPHNAIGDPGRLRQVLINLVGNAIKFTDSGEVVVRVRRDESRGPGRAAALRGRRHRHRAHRGRAGPRLLHLLAGRQLDHAQARRHRAGPRHLAHARAADGRRDRRREREGRGQPVLVHRPVPGRRAQSAGRAADREPQRDRDRRRRRQPHEPHDPRALPGLVGHARQGVRDRAARRWRSCARRRAATIRSRWRSST